MLRRRYRQILTFFAGLLLSLAYWEILLPRLGFRKIAARSRDARLARAATQYRALAIRMGGVLIKVGQFLSTRMDVLPEAITLELAGLQDEVPPEEFSQLKLVAEGEFNCSLESLFISIDTQPMAAASLGQVHRAIVQVSENGADKPVVLDVVVKIQRSGIEQIVATDLAALQTVGNWLRRYKPISRRADVPALLAEFSRILYEELDYLAEGRNAETFEHNFAGVQGIRVPRVVWTHTRKRVLTLEDVSGIKITDYASIEAAGIDRTEVADRLLATYLKQIFEDGFFHADPHPGNLFIYSIPDEHENDAKWCLTFIDFGMVGQIPPNSRLALREMLIGVGTRDTARIIHSYQMLNILLPSADLDLLERATGRLFERFWGMNMTELAKTSFDDVTELMHEFSQLIYELPFQLPHDLIFLARTVAILSGMCTGLDPQFNVWQHLAPFAQKLISEETSNGLDFWWKELKTMLGQLLALPRRSEAILGKIERGELAIRDPRLETQIDRLTMMLSRTWKALFWIALIMAGLLVLQIIQLTTH